MVLALAIVTLAVVAPTDAGSYSTSTSTERSLVGAINTVRAARGLRPLRIDRSLLRAARSHSAHLLRTDRFAHGDMGRRLARHGARGPRFGENLAWGSGSSIAPRSVVGAWMRSARHRANLLRPGWRRIGVGALRGAYRGHSAATVVTADFAGS